MLQTHYFDWINGINGIYRILQDYLLLLYTGCYNQNYLDGIDGIYRITFSVRQLFELSFDLDFVFSKVHD